MLVNENIGGHLLRVNGFLRRTIRCGYCLPDFPTFADQCATADEKLFDKICLDNNHVLHCLLRPPTSASQSYNLRPRAHSLELPQHSGHLSDWLQFHYTNVFLLTFTKLLLLLLLLFSVSIYLFIYLFPVTVYLQLRSVNVSNKRIW